jgi:hypothetical protein
VGLFFICLRFSEEEKTFRAFEISSTIMDLDPQLIFSRMTEMGLKAVTLTDLSGISSARISRVKNGAEAFSYPEFRILEQLLDDLTEIRRRAGSIPIHWANVGAVKHLLDGLKRERDVPPDLSEQDKMVMALVAQGANPADIADQLGVEVADVGQLLSETGARYQRLVDYLARSNEESRVFSEIRKSEHQASLKSTRQ